MARRHIGSALLATILLSVSACIAGEEGRIKILVMGATAAWLSPVPSWGKVEPTLELTLIPSTVPVSGLATPQIDTGRRAMRIYFPRSYELLVEHDFMIFEHMFMEFFTPAQIADMYNSITDAGLGGFVTIGGVTHTSIEPNYPWINSKLNEAFPSSASEEVFVKWKQYGAHPARVIVNRDPLLPPVLTMLVPLGIDDIRQQIVYYMAPKEGAKIWAWSRDGMENPPFLISWKYGEGETWSNSVGMGYAWWRLRDVNLGGNPFALDVFMNILIYSAGRELPTDIAKVHSAREGFLNLEELKGWVLSVIDFADRFGANTQRSLNGIIEVDRIRDAARRAYLHQDYEEAVSRIDDAKASLNKLADEAIRLKARALMWTYTIEWFAVLGTLMMTGEVLYVLMVRRRLYRAVGLTRLV